MLRPASLALASLLAGCHVSLHDHVTVDGVRLSEHHEEVVTLAEWPADGLVIEAHVGDIVVERGDGETTLTIELLEREPNEAHAHVDAGRVLARAANGATCAVGRVRVRTAALVRDLTIATGTGDVRVDGVEVAGALSLSTGVGDVQLRATGSADAVHLSTGAGDVDASGLSCARLEADTGVGDVRIDGLEASDAIELGSGVGDVDVQRSSGARIEASTGVGDVALSESKFVTRDLDTGLGSVRER
jgi:DUF4097 and DUF4098 domain-containing protein YvlB